MSFPGIHSFVDIVGNETVPDAVTDGVKNTFGNTVKKHHQHCDGAVSLLVDV